MPALPSLPSTSASPRTNRRLRSLVASASGLLCAGAMTLAPVTGVAAAPAAGSPAGAASLHAPADASGSTPTPPAKPAPARALHGSTNPPADTRATPPRASRAAARAGVSTPATRALRVAARQAAATPAGASARTTRAALTVFPVLGGFAWSTPVQGTHQSSGFGHRWGRLHAGIDFAGAVGTPLRSPSSGVVTFAGVQGGYGNKVEVTCWDGTVLHFGHMAAISVKTGQRIGPGERVGRLGNTGHSTGPHLHFEVHPGGGAPIDPRPWLLARGILPVDVTD